MKYQNKVLAPPFLGTLFRVFKIGFFTSFIFLALFAAYRANWNIVPILGALMNAYLLFVILIIDTQAKWTVQSLDIDNKVVAYLALGKIIEIHRGDIQEINDLVLNWKMKNDRLMAHPKKSFTIFLKDGRQIHVIDGMEKIDEIRLILTDRFLTNEDKFIESDNLEKSVNVAGI